MTDEIDKRRQIATAEFDGNTERHEWYAGMVRAIRQSDADAGLGYHDTKTHVAVPRERLNHLIIRLRIGGPETKKRVANALSTILAAQETRDEEV